MPKCECCGQKIASSFVHSKARQGPYNIVVATDRQLSRISHVQRLALATLNVKQEKDLPRREIPNWIANMIYGYEGDILWPVGRVFVLEDDMIDLAFANDGSFRWLSDFLHFASEPPKQKPQARVLARLRLIDLAFRIAYPKRAALIAK